ncbi:hypothetical protein GE09DRAFT_561322 [Coniochaeta sp. 2T2.1]|nr:hypothetical protein GE09DRAFT_561322 [Coniochaeta sp. 2T2.1]
MGIAGSASLAGEDSIASETAQTVTTEDLSPKLSANSSSLDPGLRNFLTSDYRWSFITGGQKFSCYSHGQQCLQRRRPAHQARWIPQGIRLPWSLIPTALIMRLLVAHTGNGAAGQVITTHGALFPDHYGKWKHEELPWICPVRSCRRLMPSISVLGNHFTACPQVWYKRLTNEETDCTSRLLLQRQPGWNIH